MLIKNWKKDLFTIPNILSLFRLVLIPVYVMIYLRANSSLEYFLAAAILAVSCLTDLIDGKIARHFDMVTAIGKILDPLADKCTQFSLIICLTARYSFLWYLVALFVLKEGFQLVAGGLNLRKGKMLKGALLSGKICTTILFVSLILLVMIPTIPLNAVYIITIVDACFMLFAFCDYIISYIARASDFQPIDDPDENNEARS